MIESISIGDTLNCLFCKKDFILEIVDFDADSEYIVCPICGQKSDTHDYHRSINSNIDILKARIKLCQSGKIRKECCKNCLFDGYMNDGRGYFCLLDGEIDNGAKRINHISAMSVEFFYFSKQYYELCDKFIDKEEYLKKCREAERLNK